jgi:hypothetical protein
VLPDTTARALKQAAEEHQRWTARLFDVRFWSAVTDGGSFSACACLGMIAYAAEAAAGKMNGTALGLAVDLSEPARIADALDDGDGVQYVPGGMGVRRPSRPGAG